MVIGDLDMMGRARGEMSLSMQLMLSMGSVNVVDLDIDCRGIYLGLYSLTYRVMMSNHF